MMKLVPMATEPDRESTKPIYLSSTIVASSDAHTSMKSEAGCGWGGGGTEERRQLSRREGRVLGAAMDAEHSWQGGCATACTSHQTSCTLQFYYSKARRKQCNYGMISMDIIGIKIRLYTNRSCGKR
jgi:hypothetical protein